MSRQRPSPHDADPSCRRPSPRVIAAEIAWLALLQCAAPLLTSLILNLIFSLVPNVCSDEWVEHVFTHAAIFGSWASWAALPWLRTRIARRIARAAVFVPIPFYCFLIWYIQRPVEDVAPIALLCGIGAAWIARSHLRAIRGRDRRSRAPMARRALCSALLLIAVCAMGGVGIAASVVALVLGKAIGALIGMGLATTIVPGAMAAWLVMRREATR